MRLRGCYARAGNEPTEARLLSPLLAVAACVDPGGEDRAARGHTHPRDSGDPRRDDSAGSGEPSVATTFPAPDGWQPERSPPPEGVVDDAHETYALFVLLVQDFSRPTLSAEVVGRLLDAHERLQVPLDVSITTTQVDLLTREAPDLWLRLATSPWVDVGYHARPPTPYVAGFDALGLSAMTTAERRAAILAIESSGLDLATGLPTEAPGGYVHLASLLGHAPLVVGAGADPALQADVDAVFAEAGATFVVEHAGGPHALGETRGGLYVRPQEREVRLYDHVDEDAGALLDEAYAGGCAASPCVVALKMHDNDLFAEASAWATVYGGDPVAPWDTSRRARPLPLEEREARIAQYVAVLEAAAARRDTVPPISARALAAAPR